MKGRTSLLTATFFVLSILWIAGSVHAKIPEPDNIIYGLLPTENSRISLQVNGEVIAQYTLGDNPAAGQHFVLRVPIDSFDPQESDTTRPGDQAMLYLDAEPSPVEMVVIGERGTIQRIFLPNTPIDTDNDGIEDSDDNCPGVANSDQDDANANNIGDACDEASDTDNDGYNDMLEYSYLYSGRLDLDGNGYDPTKVNPPGDLGYVSPEDKRNFWLLILPAILNAADRP